MHQLFNYPFSLYFILEGRSHYLTTVNLTWAEGVLTRFADGYQYSDLTNKREDDSKISLCIQLHSPFSSLFLASRTLKNQGLGVTWHKHFLCEKFIYLIFQPLVNLCLCCFIGITDLWQTSDGKRQGGGGI